MNFCSQLRHPFDIRYQKQNDLPHGRRCHARCSLLRAPRFVCILFLFFLFIFYVRPQVRPWFIPSFCVQLTFSVSNFIYYNDFPSVLTLCFRFLIFPFSLYHFPFPIAHFSFCLLRAPPALSAVDWRSLIRCNLKMLQRSNCFAANEIGAARGVYVIYA